MPSGEQRRTGRNALAFDIEIRQAEPLSHFTIVKLDVDDDSSVEAAFKGILQEKGHIDALINNAGIGWRPCGRSANARLPANHGN
jgi:NAD(P)-dependent dehydrogenase (short-subunit alcohol dehydrogenase family)